MTDQEKCARTIPLSRGKVAIVDAEDYDRLAAFRWHAKPDGNTWYAARSFRKGRTTLHDSMHRVVFDVENGVEVDHINGDGLDNRRANLRRATKSQQQANKFGGIRSATGFKGVKKASWRTKIAYEARIKVGQKQIHLGCFDTAEGAARAYDKAAKRYFGKFARLNFEEVA